MQGKGAATSLCRALLERWRESGSSKGDWEVPGGCSCRPGNNFGKKSYNVFLKFIRVDLLQDLTGPRHRESGVSYLRWTRGHICGLCPMALLVRVPMI